MLCHDKKIQGHYILSITGVTTLVYHFTAAAKDISVEIVAIIGGHYERLFL